MFLLILVVTVFFFRCWRLFSFIDNKKQSNDDVPVMTNCVMQEKLQQHSSYEQRRLEGECSDIRRHRRARSESAKRHAFLRVQLDSEREKEEHVRIISFS